MQKIHRVFIANRGEIARRIALGAQTLGIESVCLYSGRAAPAYLTNLVTAFIRIEEADDAPALFLNAQRMVAFALESGCDAVHPGFGFLSENAAFAQLVQDSGLTWIGPSPRCISAMASKAEARSLAKAHRVPIVPGIEGLGADGHDAILAFARSFGLPLLLKAAMGGGGKGMRVVRHESEIAEAVQRARSEAISSFGDGALIAERYVEFPRHVEVQILGDKHGNIYALGDRDCSVQRRHQKIIEEAPAPNLSAETRRRMHEAAIALAQAVAYDSAGTVEFLVDWSPADREKENFYFLEMNTRLQVEHPVTEQIFNEDLVAWQLRIAMGEKIKDRLNLQPQGHSIELRLYAEDAEQSFMPAPGPVFGFLPFHGPGIRWEAGIDAIDEITTRFDPMIAKIVSTGRDREQAIRRLILALKQTVLAVPTSNVSFLMDVLQNPAFSEDVPTTRFIQDNADSLQASAKARRERAEGLLLPIAQALVGKNAGERNGPLPLPDLTRRVFAKSASESSSLTVAIIDEHSIAVPQRHGHRRTTVGRGSYQDPGSGVNGSFAFCQCFHGESWIRWISIDGEACLKIESRDDATASGKSGAHAHDVLAPVPGRLVKLLIAAGSLVQEKQTLCILESMKMEFEVKATRAGTIAEVLVSEGQQVQADTRLAHWQES